MYGTLKGSLEGFGFLDSQVQIFSLLPHVNTSAKVYSLPQLRTSAKITG